MSALSKRSLYYHMFQLNFHLHLTLVHFTPLVLYIPDVAFLSFKSSLSSLSLFIEQTALSKHLLYSYIPMKEREAKDWHSMLVRSLYTQISS